MLAVIAQAASGEARSKRQADIDRQKTKLGLIDRYMGAKAAVGAEKRAAWDYNKRQLFEEEARTKSSLSGSAIYNVMGGARTVVGAAMMRDKKTPPTGGIGAGAGLDANRLQSPTMDSSILPSLQQRNLFGSSATGGMKGFGSNINQTKNPTLFQFVNNLGM